MIKKDPIISGRIRRPPREGFSWIDRRFLQKHASKLSREAILLYFFLAAVSDKHGLSFYSDATTAVRLRLTEQQVVQAREQLVADDLVAHQDPLTQVLSITERPRHSGGASQIGEIFRILADQDSSRQEKDHEGGTLG